MFDISIHHVTAIHAEYRSSGTHIWMDLTFTGSRGCERITVFVDRHNGEAYASRLTQAINSAETPETVEAAADVVRGIAAVLGEEVARIDATADELAERRMQLERGRSGGPHGDEIEHIATAAASLDDGLAVPRQVARLVPRGL